MMQTLWKPLVAAVLLRIAWALLVPIVPVSDSVAYVTFARNLIEHGVFGFEANRPFAFWPPGTSFAYASVFAFTGIDVRWAVPANILMTLAIIWSAARIAGRLYSRRTAQATAWVIALWPTLVMYTTIVASELPFVLLITLAIDLWTQDGRGRVWKAALAGLVLGAAALVRPLALIFPFLLTAPGLWTAWQARQGWRLLTARLAIALVAMFLVVLPWTIRNAGLYDRTVLISTNGGTTFWMGNTPGTDGGYMDIPADLAGSNDAEVETELRARAWTYIRAEPLEFAKRTAWKGIKLYAFETVGVSWNEPGIVGRFGQAALLPLKLLTQAGWMAILLMAAAGAWRQLREHGFLNQALSPVILPVLALSAVHAITVSQDRYHLGYFSLLAILAGSGALTCAEWLMRRRRGAATTRQ